MSAFFANRRGQPDAETEESVTVLPTGQPVGFDTVIGSNSETEGTFTSSGNVRMDGKFTGSLEIAGNILVGESADIHADINARNISIAGTVRGNVAGNKVQLLRTGRIWGDINASALTTEEGAFIEGKVTMTGHTATQLEADVEFDEEGNAVRLLATSADGMIADGDFVVEEAEVDKVDTDDPGSTEADLKQGAGD